MKKISFILIIICLALCQSFAQTTATDFEANDCSGNYHHLFSELDSGKVVIIDFVMPCGACLPPTKTVYNIIQNYEITNPGRFLFYLSDGFGSHKCDTLTIWAADNNVDSNTIIISTSGLTLLDYNGLGMPKIVVLGGSNHHVYFDKNDEAAGDSSGLCIAIDSALNANQAVYENNINDFNFNLFPNPACDKVFLSFTAEEETDIKIEIFSSVNENVFTSTNKCLTRGKHETEINLEKFTAGNYILKISSGKGFASHKFSIVK